MKITSSSTPLSSVAASPLRATLWLLLGAGFTALTAYPSASALPAWLGLFFFLRFFRTHRPSACVLLFAARWAALYWIAHEAMPAPLGVVLGITAFESLLDLLPFVADRWLAARTGGVTATLIFPCWVTALEFFLRRAAPYGTWGSPAYLQMENPLLCQIAALVGLAGITFFVAWSAAVANAVCASAYELKPHRRTLISFVAITAAMLLFGGIRLACHAPTQPETNRIAGIAAPESNLFPDAASANAFYGAGLTAEQLSAVKTHRAESYDSLFALTAREAHSGAKLVLWSEGAASIFSADETAFVARGCAVARSEKIYLAMTLFIHGKSVGAERWHNRLILIRPTGEIAWAYDKTHLVPGFEESVFAAGDGRLRTLDTPEFGRLGAGICFDAAFPEFIAQAGRQQVDLLLAPAHLWPAAAEMDARMSALRAVENGLSIFRCTGNGLNVAVDPVGRVLALQKTIGTQWSVFTADVPRHRAPTLYPWTHDAFGWLTAAAALGALLRWRRKLNSPQAASISAA